MVTLAQLSAPQLERLLQAALRDEARGLGGKKVAVEEEVTAGKLHAVQVNGLAKRKIGLVEHRGRRRSQATEAFLDLLREFVAAGKILRL